MFYIYIYISLLRSCSEPAPVEASTPAPVPAPLAAEAYTCSICGQQLRNQRALNNHLHNKHNTTSGLSLTVSICSSCGELAGNNHRCSSKAKYTCDVCSKSFKMKRYLEVSKAELCQSICMITDVHVFPFNSARNILPHTRASSCTPAPFAPLSFAPSRICIITPSASTNWNGNAREPLAMRPSLVPRNSTRSRRRNQP